MIERRHMAYFLAVAEKGSISAAAKGLQVSQPSVSEAIRRLEELLGTELFLRAPRGVRLTRAGQVLLGPASQVMRDFGAVDMALEPIRRLHEGELTVVCPRTLARNPTTPLVGRFRSTHPGVEITVVRPGPREVAADTLASGRAEVGFGVRPSERADVVSELYERQDVVVIAAPDQELRPAPTLDEVLACGLVTAPRGAVTRNLVESIVGTDRFERSVVFESSYLGATIPAVAAGVGVAFVPEGLATEAEAAGLRVLEPRPALSREVFLLRRQTLSPAAEAFWKMARDRGATSVVD